MKRRFKLLILFLIILDIALIERILIGSHLSPILFPQGIIALQERNLIFVAVSLMFVVVVPVFILAFYVALKYHSDSKKAAYHPNWDHNTKLQLFIWGFPTVIVCILSSLVWVSAHKLDPHVAIASDTKPMTIQVVALRWKWLFIYPEQGIATVNYVVFPEKTPIHFELTGYDAPMNSFWIPQLGGQIYAMSGMATQTHLMANSTGEYRGSTAEISGEGFASMVFSAKSVSSSDFDSWVVDVKQSQKNLTMERVKELAKPSENYPKEAYSSTEDKLFNTIVMQYMAHSSKDSEKITPEEKNMDSMEPMSGM